jgi:hypothetical protein
LITGIFSKIQSRIIKTRYRRYYPASKLTPPSMFRLKILLVLYLILPPFTATSQAIIIGIVIDDDTEEPLSKASIKTSGSAEFIVTDESGAFRVENLKTSDTLVVTYVGYNKFTLPVAEINLQTKLVVRLKREATLLNEISVFSEFWTKQYSPKQLKEDIEKFYTIMEKTHTGLFDYLKEEQWQAMKDSSLQLCQYPMNHSEFYRLIALHVGKVRNVRTRHGVTDSWYKRKQNIFPFNIRYFGDKMIVQESLVNELSFSKGTEITEVNGRTPAQIKSMIWPFIPADGYNETGRLAALNDYFPWYFALFVEEAESFTVRLKQVDGEETTLTTAGLVDAFSRLSFRQVWKWKKTPLELRLNDSLKTAYLRIDDSRVFRDSLQAYFKTITTHGVQHLIVDLRGEGIRDQDHAAELYSYILHTPSLFYERIEVKSNDYTLFDKDYTFRPYFKSRKHVQDHLSKLIDSGKGYYSRLQETDRPLIKPSPIRFSGTTYILTDGRNYSACTDLTAMASQLENVFIIGEETGGEYRSRIGGAEFGLVLPNSKIGIKIPTWKSVLALEENPAQRGRGVIPDYIVAESLDDFIKGRDPVKEFAYELIRNKQ